MDRRQKKTRQAIFNALEELLQVKAYDRITIQDIIQRADVGRSTFYSHFETKDELLHAICSELLSHVVHAAHDCSHTHGLPSGQERPLSVFCHSLKHLQENDHNILRLLACESNAIFLGYFSRMVEAIVRSQLPLEKLAARRGVPEEFLLQYIASSYISMVKWWLKNCPELPPQELAEYFHRVIGPLTVNEDESCQK